MPEFIEARIQLATSEQGGRQAPVLRACGHYAPHLRVEGEGDWLGVRLSAGPQELRPGESSAVTWELLYEGVDYSALQVGTEFQILEGPHIVGSGTVLRRWQEEGLRY